MLTGRPGARSRRLRKWIATVVLVLLGAASSYLVGINVLLGTRLFRDSFASAQGFVTVDYDRAYSILPGRIHVEGLRIRGGDGAVEWLLGLDRCDFVIFPLELLHRRFHARHVYGHGLEFRARLRFDRATAEHIAALPEVDGFPDPPLKDIGPPQAPPTDAEYHLWSALLEDVDAEHVRLLWVDTLRLSGEMHMEGRWLFRPLRELDVGPATVDLDAVDISYGSKPLATDTSGQVRLTVASAKIRPDQPNDIVARTSGDLGLRANARWADAVTTLIRTPSVRFVRGSGPLSVRAIVDHGALRPGTSLMGRSSDSVLEAGGAGFEATLRAALAVTSETSQRAVARFAADALQLRVRMRQAEARATSVETTFVSRDLDLTHPFGDASFEANVHGFGTDRIGPWADLLPPSAKVTDGSGRLQADARLAGSVARREARGHLSFHTYDANFAIGGATVLGDLAGELAIAHVSLPEERITLGPSRLVGRMSAQLGPVFLRAGDTDVRADRASISFRRDPDVDVSGAQVTLGEVTADIQTTEGATGRIAARRLTAHSDRLGTVDAGPYGTIAIALGGAAMKDVARMLTFISLPSGIGMEGGRATGDLRGNIDIATLVANGEGDLRLSDLFAHAHQDMTTADLTVRLRCRGRPREWNLSGTTVTATGRTNTNDARWWGSVELRNARVDVSQGIVGRAEVHLSAKDASPLVPLIAATTPVPEWLARLPPTDGLTGDGEVLIGPSSLELRAVDVRGGPFAVRLAYAKNRSVTDGALYLADGALSAGFGLGPSEASFVLFGAGSWFDGVASRIERNGRQERGSEP